MAAVTFKIYTGSNPVVACKKADITGKPAFVDGQIIFAQKQHKIFMDWGDTRTDYSPTATIEGGGVNYVGISSTDPMSGTVTIGGSIYTPNEKDMVVFENKEYLYRYGKPGDASTLGWYEVGDEDAYKWILDEDSDEDDGN